MASADTGVNMVPAGEGYSGNSPSITNPTPSSIKPKRFEIRKWNAVALWDWDCAICRNRIMDLCIECQAKQASAISEECKLASDSLWMLMLVQGRGNQGPLV